MTWKRVVTAAVLIPLVVGLVLWCATWVVALGVSIFIVLALLEYFALGEAIGWRGHRGWTILCALVLVFLQWMPSVVRVGDFGSYSVPGGLAWLVAHIFPRAEDGLFLFVMGLGAMVLFTKRPLVETLPAAGISTSALLLVAFPLTYAVRLHGWGEYGPWLLLFALVITWAGDTGAYFAGRAFGKHAAGAASFAEENVGGEFCRVGGVPDCGGIFSAMAARADSLFAGDGLGGKCGGAGGGFAGVGL